MYKERCWCGHLESNHKHGICKWCSRREQKHPQFNFHATHKFSTNYQDHCDVINWFESNWNHTTSEYHDRAVNHLQYAEKMTDDEIKKYLKEKEKTCSHSPV